jgi:hypothetical protein
MLVGETATASTKNNNVEWTKSFGKEPDSSRISSSSLGWFVLEDTTGVQAV